MPLLTQHNNTKQKDRFPRQKFNFINASYIVAGVLFILALAGLSKFETSKRGNAFGMVGMLIAIIATIVWLVRMPDYHPSSMLLLFIPMIIGGAILASARVR